MLKPIAFSLSFSVAMSSWSALAFAQAPAPPSEDDDVELDVPSRPAPNSPAASPPATSPPPATNASAPTSEPSESVAALRKELEALRLRVAKVEESKTAPEAVNRPEGNRSEDSARPVNLEATAHSRPVPHGLKIGGYLQTQYEANQSSEDQLQQGGAPLNQDRFSLRRGRLRLDRGWDYASATLELDANTVRGPNVGIRRAEGSVFYRGKNDDKLPPLVMLTLGVTDLPFGYELMESARTRAFMERSTSSGAFFPTEMDVGAKVSGAVEFFRYAVAITNGEPVDNVSSRFPRDPNAAKDVTGRFGVDFSLNDKFAISGGTSFSRGKGFSPGKDATKQTVFWRDANLDGVLQPNTELEAVNAIPATPSKNFERWAFGLDLQVKFKTLLGTSRVYGEAYIAQNYDRGVIPVDPVASSTNFRHIGGYGAVVQDVTQYAYAGFRASVYNPNSDALDTRRGNVIPKSQTITTLSPLIGARLPNRASLSFQYDFVRDALAKDARGVPTDLKNNQWTLRLQVEL